jgi:hypothetical protein
VETIHLAAQTKSELGRQDEGRLSVDEIGVRIDFVCLQHGVDAVAIDDADREGVGRMILHADA